MKEDGQLSKLGKQIEIENAMNSNSVMNLRLNSLELDDDKYGGT